MPGMWCISCQAEQEHLYVYGQEPCREGGSCEHKCRMCEMNTLAYIQPRTNATQEEMIKQMVGEAQREAQRTDRTGDIEVSRVIGNTSGSYQTQILVYNTNTGFYRFSRR